MGIKTCSACPFFDLFDEPIITEIMDRKVYIGGCYCGSLRSENFILIEIDNFDPDKFVCEFPGEREEEG